MRQLIVIVLLLLLSCPTLVRAQDILGRWTTIDDRTGKPRSVVELSERGGKLYGHIVDLHEKAHMDKVCDKCSDERAGQRIVGLEIIRDMVRTGKEWGKGTILDPESGGVYECKIWLEDGQLKVRGYVMFLYRTQTWVR